jgi:hypothetical protein
MDFTNDERFDGLYLNVAQTARGIEPLLDTLFSFLRRKTDFFNGPNGQDTDAAIEKVNQVLMKHVDLHKAEQARKKKQKEMEEERKKQRVSAKNETQKVDAGATKHGDEDVIEMGDDGFDVSSPLTRDSSSVDQEMESSKEVGMQHDDATNDQDNDEQNDNEQRDGSLAPVGNGGTVEGKYVWTQTLSELNVCIPLPQNTKGRDLTVIIKKDHLKAGLRSSPEPIVDAPLTHSIICDDSFWTVEDGNRLVVSLQKLNQMEWWDSVCKGDPKIDVTKVQPENSRLDELDGETRQTVEKMMFDQRQKALGLPTSDDQKKMEALERFKKAHPELDFSNAKIS